MSSITPSFEQAIEIAFLWCSAWDEGELSDEVIAERVSELITTPEGARGFFVVSLASDCPLLDRLPDILVMKLREAGDPIIDLTVRNLAMSSAMALHHQRQDDHQQKEGSERVMMRCKELLKLLDPNQVRNRLERILNAINGEGEYLAFLEKWNYDSEQKQAITNSVMSVAEA